MSTGGGALFDRFVMVDWSAAANPTRGEDSIWRAVLDVRSGYRECVNHPTRADAEAAILSDLSMARQQRVLLGVDFALGYPAGYAGRLLNPGANWRSLWAAIDEVISDDDRNANNRFAAAARLNERAGFGVGPFWGCPPDHATGSLPTTKPWGLGGQGGAAFEVGDGTGQASLLAEYRLAEQRLRQRGLRPFSVWQLYGAGAVGSQTLVGIPALRRLAERSRLSRRMRVWPFDTGCVADPTIGRADTIVVAEIWPTMFGVGVDDSTVRDARQVTAVCEQLATLDHAGQLGAMFAPALSETERQLVEREEGWILGA